MYKNIVWSAESCTLKTFVESYTLPQLVQVENGFYSEDEAKTLSAQQILTLHCTKRTDKVLAKAAERKRPFFIPVNLPCKVEILPTICQDRYYSVHDIVNESSVKFIRVIHDGPPSFGLKAGNILKLKITVEENRGKYIECELQDKTRDLVKIPLDFKAAFDPLACAEQYHFQEVLNSFKFPVRVKFISSDTTIQDVNSEIDLLSLGSVLLKSIHEESTIIATSRADKTVTVVMIRSDLDVSVYPAKGAITGDETYARFCRNIHDGADLEKVDLSLANVLRWGDEPNVEVLYDYVEMKPPVPSRKLSSQWESDDSQDDYYDVEVPPTRPPKTPNLTAPPTSQTHTFQKPQNHDNDFCENLPNDHDDDDDLDAGDRDSDDSSSSSQEYIYPDEQIINSENPPIAPQDGVTSYDKRTNDNDDDDEHPNDNEFSESDQVPPRPPRTTSLQQYNSKTADHGADTSYDKRTNDNDDDEHPSSAQEYLAPVECHLKIPPKRPPLIPPKPKPPLQQDRELDKVFKDLNENTHCQVPRPPVRAVSPQRSDENFSNSVHDQKPILSGRITEPTKSVGSDTSEEDEDWGSNDSSSSSHEYIYPENTPIAPQQQANLDLRKRGSLKKRISGVFKKVTSKFALRKSKSVTSQAISAASISADKTPIPSSPTASNQNYSSSGFPDDLECLSVTEVGECLRKLKMEKHVDTFDSNQIDGKLFLTLDEKSLTSLDVTDAFEQTKIMIFIHGWRPKTN